MSHAVSSIAADATEISDAIARLTSATERIVAAQGAAAVADEDIAGALIAAARLYSAKTDRIGRFPWPLGSDALNATDTVRLATALLDAADVNLLDMAIWYRRAE